MRSTRYALWLALAYVTLAGGYISISGALAVRLSRSVSELARIEEIKGTAFVLVTGLAVFLGSRLALGRIESAGTELMLRERALASSSRRAFAGLMASSVAHDANNVLTVVLGDLTILEEEPESAAEALSRLRRSVHNLIALNRRLLQMVRQQATAELVPIELTRATRESIELVRQHAAVRRVAVEVTDGGPIILRAHEILLAQIVGNLVINAAEASGEHGTIWVHVGVQGDEAVIEVHDAGLGIPEERRATLFESLESTKAQGNGMGLFSVKACALGLSGRVEVTGSPRGGACFRVLLPLAPVKVERAPATAVA